VKFDEVKAAWYKNADDTADFLADLNPSWDRADLKQMFEGLLDRTLGEAMARIDGAWAIDITKYDEVVEQVLVVSDTLTDGIAQQFTHTVKQEPRSDREQELQLSMRNLWQDHVTWSRVVILDTLAGLRDKDTAVARLMLNQIEIGDAIKPYYGDVIGNQLAKLLKTQIVLTLQMVSEAMGKTDRLVAEPKQQWYANGDEIVALLTQINPGWDATVLKALMKHQLDLTLAETNARLAGDWDEDVRDFDALVTQILIMSDVLSNGISAQFPDGAVSSPRIPITRNTL